MNYSELAARCNCTFVPQSADDFIGDARQYALLMAKGVKLSNENDRVPLKYLLNGRPGLGKSALVLYLQRLLGLPPNDKFSTTKLNGTQLTIDRVNDIAASFHYKSLFGEWRMLWIDEADEIPRVAQVRFLTLLDDLPAGVVVACTSNCKLKDFEPRFQSRFQAFEVQPPTAAQIAGLIGKFITHQPSITQISEFSGGNVRQALLDCQGALQAAA